jgi:hypothetical protein
MAEARRQRRDHLQLGKPLAVGAEHTVQTRQPGGFAGAQCRSHAAWFPPTCDAPHRRFPSSFDSTHRENSIMRNLVLAATLLASGAAIAADSSNFRLRDTNDLVVACSVPAEHTLYANATGFCHGVLVGAYSYYNATVPAEGRFVCPPNPVPTRAKVMNDFVAWAKARPQVMKDPPLDALFRYLEEAYPCRK